MGIDEWTLSPPAQVRLADEAILLAPAAAAGGLGQAQGMWARSTVPMATGRQPKRACAVSDSGRSTFLLPHRVARGMDADNETSRVEVLDLRSQLAADRAWLRQKGIAKLIYRDTMGALARGDVLGIREEGIRLREFVD